MIDWKKSTESPFEIAENEFEEKKVPNAKKVIIENNSKRLKMIVYRELKDGGIQGILLDFYFDEASGQIANEFLRIQEREDGEVELIKVESGIKPIMDH